jgi:hypothetical protein
MHRVNWELIEVSEPTPGWFELEDSSWDALISATAGEENVVRRKRRSLAITEQDQEIIDTTTDEYLVAADIPARPHGYDWFLRPPPELPYLDALHSKINMIIAERAPQAFSPEKAHELVEAALRKLYS